MGYELYKTWGFNIFLDVSESPMMMMRSKEQYEVEKFKWIRDNLRRNDAFVDVGANKGDFTLMAAQFCSTAIAFEPHPDNVEWLRKSIAENKELSENILVEPYCLSNETGTVKLNTGARSGYHSIISKNHKTDTIDVKSERLDRLLYLKEGAEIVMKIDVEGAEKLVLEGAVGIMDKVRAILIDVDSGDHGFINTFMKEHGFKETYRHGKEVIFEK